MPPAYEVLLLNTAIPQIQAAQAGDTYVVPRDIAINATAIISANSATDALRITQTGAGNALVVEDSANPDSTPFVVSAAGDVGIGTSSPSVKLQVNVGTVLIETTASNSKAQLLLGSAGANYGQIQNDSAGVWSLGYGAGYSSLGTPVLTWNTSGNVGIGTSSPVSAFGLGQTASGTGITFQSTSTTFNSGKAAVIKASIPGSGNGVLIFETYEGGSGGGERARISSDGTFRVKGAGTAGSTDAVQFSGSAPASALTLQASGGLSIGNTTDLGAGNIAIAAGKYLGYSSTAYMTPEDNVSGARIVTPGIIRFDAGGTTERARITSGGDLLVGTDNSSESVGPGLKLINSAVSPAYLCVMDTATAGNSGFIIYNVNATNNGYRAYLQSNGGLANYQANDVNLSDERLKTDVTPVASYWDKIKSLEIVSFKYKDQSDSIPNIGVIAQQVESVAPEFVSNDGFGEAPEGEAPYKTIYTTDMYHAAIKALQEAMSRIETLEAKIAALEQGA